MEPYKVMSDDVGDIVFKRGYLEGHQRGWNDGYKAGIREAAKFVDTHKLHGGNISIPKFLWQAFKESRGITNP